MNHITPVQPARQLGRAVVASPTPATLEAVSVWHLSRFWSDLARQIPVRFGTRRRTLAHA
jgi:hypothetical protein